MNLEEEFDKDLKENLVFLLGYFVASVSHDRDEWDAWGLQYIKMCAECLGLDISVVTKVNDTFIGTIGHGYLFIFDDVEDGWTHVHHLSYFLERLAQQLDKWDEETVIRYFLTTLADSISRGNYDARVRVLISHRICSMFNIPDQTIAELEVKAIQSTNIDKEFDTTPAMDIGGAVGSFRAWKVGFAAASGGALMFCAGGLSAPAIVASIVSLLGASGTTSAVAVNMTSLLTAHGIAALTSSMTTAGVGLASFKMLRRTGAIREFSLEPLQPPVVQHMSASSVMIDWKEPSLATTCTSQLEQRIGSVGVISEQKERGVGVYVLVAGHHSETVDLRDLWGCDKYVERKGDEYDAAADFHLESMETGQQTGYSHHSTDSERDGSSWGSLSTESGVFVPRGSPSDAVPSDYGVDGWWRKSVSQGPAAGEPFVLSWDRSEMHRLYHAQRTFLRDKSVLMAAEELLKLASPVIGAAALPIAVLERAAELDCPWLVAMDRAEQAGKLLASVLLKNRHLSQETVQGEDIEADHSLPFSCSSRPVTLVGYGMGARAIFHCLLALSQDEVDGGRGIVENAVLIGTPVGTHHQEWVKARGVVAGRLVNCYSTQDWFLALMYRCRSWDVGVAGLQPVYIHPASLDSYKEFVSSADEESYGGEEGSFTAAQESKSAKESSTRKLLKAVDTFVVDDVENINITALVESHVEYWESLKYILPSVFPAND